MRVVFITIAATGPALSAFTYEDLNVILVGFTLTFHSSFTLCFSKNFYTLPCK